MVQLEELTTISAPMERCFDLARSVEVHLAGNVHFSEQAVAAAGVTSGLVGMGQRVTWRAKHFGVWWNLTSEITALERPIHFQDAMVRGIFRYMKHDHYFLSLPSGETEMKDVFRFAAPWPVLGLLAEVVILRRYMRALLRERKYRRQTDCRIGRMAQIPAARSLVTVLFSPAISKWNRSPVSKGSGLSTVAFVLLCFLNIAGGPYAALRMPYGRHELLDTAPRRPNLRGCFRAASGIRQRHSL